MRKLILLIIIVFSTSVLYAENFKYDDHGKRDPMWTLVTSAGTIITYGSDFTLSDLSLEGIMYGENNSSLAIINGNIVTQNEKIGVYTVLEITPTTVVLTKGEEKFTLKLKKED